MSYLLAVDDDTTTLFLIETIFRRAGLEGEVVTALDGEEAIELAEARRQPALIVLDLRMPRMDGFEFLDELAARQLWSTVPVIVHTSSPRPEDHVRARSFPAVLEVVEKLLTAEQAGELIGTYFRLPAYR